MTNRYETLFADLEKASTKAYMPYVMLGYPTMGASLEIAQTLLDHGAHGLEIGLPFSDPMADGPVIQQAGQEALKNGFKTAKAIEAIKQLRAKNPTSPFTLMCYYNMVMAKGVDTFIQQFSKAGIDGILVPDLPLEAAHEIAPACEKNAVELVLIASSLSDDTRLKLISQHAGGFLYVVSRVGITGVEELYDDQLQALLKRIRAHSDLPAIVGFGISEPEQARHMVKNGADGVITGSRIVQLAKDNAALQSHTKKMVEAVS